MKNQLFNHVWCKMRAEVFLQGLVAFLIVAFGQPSFAPWLGPIAAAVGYALFWRAIRLYPFSRQRFWRTGVWYASVCFVQLSWMSAIEYQGFYIIFVWLGLALLLGIQFGLLSILIPYNRGLSIPRILAIASLWTLMEWSRFYYFCGFSWNLSGLALSNMWAMQWASLFGVLGLSFWVIFSNLIGLRAFLKKGIPRYLTWAFTASIPYLFGLGHMAYHKANMARHSGQYTTAVVQTGLLPCEKSLLQGKMRHFISPYQQWGRILSLLQGVKDQPLDLVVLPEAAVPYPSEECVYEKSHVERIFSSLFPHFSSSLCPDSHIQFINEESQKVSNSFWVQALSNCLNCDVVIGMDHQDFSGKSFNSAFYTTPFAQNLERYDKRVLMPLAEYLPLPILAPLVAPYGLTEFFTHGKEAIVFRAAIPFSVSICYEETFPQKVLEGRQRGAQMFVSVTNDGWYPFSRLPSQHYEHAKFRAVENGVPLIRACNTGISAAMNSLGQNVGRLEEQGSSKQLQSKVLVTTVSTYTYKTLFMLWGNWGIIGLSSAFFLSFLFFKKKFYW